MVVPVTPDGTRRVRPRRSYPYTGTPSTSRPSTTVPGALRVMAGENAVSTTNSDRRITLPMWCSAWRTAAMSFE